MAICSNKKSPGTILDIRDPGEFFGIFLTNCDTRDYYKPIDRSKRMLTSSVPIICDHR